MKEPWKWTKGQTEKIIKEKDFQFVYSETKVKEFFDQKKYAIVKQSKYLKELIQERKLPINNEISNLKKGYYYIIDTTQEKTELKSRTQITDIAYALYRETKADTYGNKIYQVNITNLVNGISLPKNYPTEQINKGTDLIGQSITVLSADWSEETKSTQIVWTTVQKIETPEEWEEFEKLNKPMTEEEDLQMQALESGNSQEEFDIDQAYENSLDFFDE